MEMNGMVEDVRVICIIKLQQSNHMVMRLGDTTKYGKQHGSGGGGWQKQNNLATSSTRSQNFCLVN